MIKYCKFKNCTYRCCQFHWVNRKFDNIPLFDMTVDSRCRKKKKTKLIVLEEQKVTQCHRKVICIETEKIYESIKSVSNDGFNPKCVCECCCGRQKTHKGYHWMHYEDYLLTNKEAV